MLRLLEEMAARAAPAGELGANIGHLERAIAAGTVPHRPERVAPGAVLDPDPESAHEAGRDQQHGHVGLRVLLVVHAGMV